MCCQPRSPLLPALLLLLARSVDASRMTLTEMDPKAPIAKAPIATEGKAHDAQQSAPPLFFGYHGHHEHHEHRPHRKKCIPKLEAVSTEEMGLIRSMMKVHEPKQLGKGGDVLFREGQKRPEYNGLEVVAAWKVDPEAKPMQAYMKLVNKLNAERGGDHWVGTAQDATATQARQNGLLGDNEYWMLHGSPPGHMETELCHGATYPGKGAFGEGVYMADEADKMDQYVQLDSGAEHLKAILEQPLDENTDAAVARQGGIYLAYVMRAYLGVQAEVQVYKHGHNSNTWYWYDPQSDRTEVVEKEGQLGMNSEKPPFDGTTFDSVKVMCSRHNKDFKHKFPTGFHGDFPKRFNEYLVPSSERLAIQYIVAYERVNN